jgi:hypothetical protein
VLLQFAAAGAAIGHEYLNPNNHLSHSSSIKAEIAFKLLNTQPLTQVLHNCIAASASADFAYRNSLQQYPTDEPDSRWGPHLNWYPPVAKKQVGHGRLRNACCKLCHTGFSFSAAVF